MKGPANATMPSCTARTVERLSDGDASTLVTVMITVHGANDGPTAIRDTYSVDENGTLGISADGLAGTADPAQQELGEPLLSLISGDRCPFLGAVVSANHGDGVPLTGAVDTPGGGLIDR